MPEHPYKNLLYAVGRGLHIWSLVEMNLARFFASLSGANAPDLFGAVISFETRLAMVDRLVHLGPHHDHEKAMWAKLSARLSKSYKKRHELAHFTVGRDKADKPIIRPFLTMSNILDEHQKALTTAQVNERVRKFIELGDALDWFTKITPRRRMPLQEPRLPPLEEPPLVARLRELAAQSPQEQRKPPPAS